MKQKHDRPMGTDDTVIVGRNSVTEALRSGREIDKILISHGGGNGSLAPLLAKARQKGILVKEVSPAKLDFMAGGAAHQGVAAVVAQRSYCSVADILAAAEEKGEPPFIVICDEIEDPHNLGAIVRTAEACGVHGVIIPKHRSATLNATVAKSASGALEYMRVAKVTNLANTVRELQQAGVWVFGADMDGEPAWQTDYTMPVALVIGSEGKGLGQLIKKNCDKIVSLPMLGKINSLNASVAAGVLMYAVVKSRG